MSNFLSISANIPDLKKVFKELNGMPEVLDSFAEAGALEALNLAIRDVPKDEGFLVGSLNIEPNRAISPSGVWTLKANADYAPYVEFGTGEKVNVPNELKNFALQFKGEKKIVGQKDQPYLYPSALVGQRRFKDFLLKWIDKTKNNKG